MENCINNDQIEIILQYLKIETNYAVIINGEYGIGKTYFYKNILIPKIKETPIIKNNTKFYKPVHISLFGLKSIEEIQSAIFIELFPWLKNKKIKLAASIGKTLLRGIAQLKNIGNIDDYIGDLKQDKNDWLKFDELVICFDDIDRRSNSLDLRDVFGFINSLVENQGVKIIIIANIKELEKDENYSANLREKVIGVTIQYNPNPKDIFDNIIKERYSSPYKVYSEYLKSNKEEILKVIKINKNNFRNLIFFLEHFKTIFNSLEEIFQADKAFAILKEEKQKAVLNFTLTISVEYKLGLLNSTNYDKLKGLSIIPIANINFDIIQNALNSEEENAIIDKPNYLEDFKNKYEHINKFYFFDSILKYIIGIKAFDIRILKNELENYFIFKDGIIPEYEQVIKKLEYLDCLKLSLNEYRSLTKKMLKYIDNGVYQLNQYHILMIYATRFDNLLKYNLDNLTERFKKGIKKGFNNYNYNKSLDFEIHIYNEIEFYKNVFEIGKFCIDENNKLIQKIKSNELDYIINKFRTDFNTFLEDVNDDDSKYKTIPFWNDFDIKKTYNRINKLDGDQIWNLGYYFKKRYRKDIQPYLLIEKDFVIGLNEILKRTSKARLIKNIHNSCLNFLSKCLDESISNFPKENINND